MQRFEHGYTLIEMLVAISMSTLLIIAIGTYATNGVVGSNQDYNKTLVLTNAKEAVGIVARQIRLARSVLAANALPDNHAPGAPGNLYSWSGTAGSGTSLILAIPSRTAGGDIIYIDGMHTQVYTDNVVFYLDASTKRLYRRLIANASAPSNAAITTCPPTLATQTCPPDADVVDDVANLSTNYLKADGTTTTIPDSTEAVNYTVTETRIIGGKSYSGTYNTIATLRNR
jgi:type II secretory pathway pseudopilin PulG